MADRSPAQAVIEELLRLHADTPPRSRLARIFGRSPLSADCVSWYEGARGEIAVGKILASLPAGWKSYHALPIGKKGADIDHLVIGPAGVFTINTKHHKGKPVWVAGRTLMVSGQKQPHIRNAETEARRVTTLLRERVPELPLVQPLLALVDPKTLTIKKKPELVTVLTATRLKSWLLRRPALLSAAQLDEVNAIVSDPDTWSSETHPPALNCEERFASLHAEVQTARFRRVFWALGGLVVLLLAGPPLVSALFQVYASAVLQP